MSRAEAEPPSPKARLVLFCELVDDYEELAAGFPVDQSGFAFGGKPRPAADRWNRVVRAVVLRKFVFSTTDQVYVPTVLEAVRECLADPADNDVIDKLVTEFHGLALEVRVNEGESGTYTAPEIIRDFIYGGLLHGDYDKHQQVRARPDLTHEMTLCLFTTSVESYVRKVRNLIRNSLANGELVADEDCRP